MLITFPAYFIQFDLITVAIFGEGYNLRSSSFFMHTSAFLPPGPKYPPQHPEPCSKTPSVYFIPM